MPEVSATFERGHPHRERQMEVVKVGYFRPISLYLRNGAR